MPVVERFVKKAKDLRGWTRLGGGALSATIDWAFAHYWHTAPEVPGWPWVHPFGTEKLPPCDDLIAWFVVPGLLDTIGVGLGIEPLEDIGDGGIIYGAGSCIHSLLWRNVTAPAAVRFSATGERRLYKKEEGKWKLVKAGKKREEVVVEETARRVPGKEIAVELS